MYVCIYLFILIKGQTEPLQCKLNGYSVPLATLWLQPSIPLHTGLAALYSQAVSRG